MKRSYVWLDPEPTQNMWLSHRYTVTVSSWPVPAWDEATSAGTGGHEAVPEVL